MVSLAPKRCIVMHVHDIISSLRGEVCAHQSNWTLSFFIDVPVPNHEREWVMYMCVRSIDCTCFYHLCIRFWNCSDCVESFVFRFAIKAFCLYWCSDKINMINIFKYYICKFKEIPKWFTECERFVYYCISRNTVRLRLVISAYFKLLVLVFWRCDDMCKTLMW